jgi:hypothetical protein
MTTPAQPQPETSQVPRPGVQALHRAATDLAASFTALADSHPAAQGPATSGHGVDPVIGLRAARDLESAGRQLAREYIRMAREAGYTWRDIGTELPVMPDTTTIRVQETEADTAYAYAVGTDPDIAREYGHSVTWTCRSCDAVISDYGVRDGPDLDEEGHAPDCHRLADATAAWQAERAAEQELTDRQARTQSAQWSLSAEQIRPVMESDLANWRLSPEPLADWEAEP